MVDMVQAVQDFHDKFGVENYAENYNEDGSFRDNGKVDWDKFDRITYLREKINEEEIREFWEAWDNFINDPVTTNREDLLKEMCDVIYVIIGTALVLGFDITEAFDRVQKSNMTKSQVADTDEAKLKGIPVGKISKGPEYKKADMSGLV